MSIIPKLRWSGRPSRTSDGEEDHPCARAEHRHPGGQARGERLEQRGRAEQPRHRRALAARHHQGVDGGEVSGSADLRGVRAEPGKHALVRVERALQREHTDDGPALHLGADRSSLRTTSPARRSAR